MQPITTTTYPRIAIRCKNPQCRDRGRVLAETDGQRLLLPDGAYIAAHTRVWCPTCDMAQHWYPKPIEALCSTLTLANA